MSQIRRRTMVNSVRSMIETKRFFDARDLLGFYQAMFANDVGILSELSLLEMEIELNDGDVERAIAALRSRAFDEYSTLSASTLIDYCSRVRRHEEAEEICAFTQESIREAIARTEPSRRKAELQAARRYYLSRELKLAMMNGRDQAALDRLKSELDSLPGEGNQYALDTMEEKETLDPTGMLTRGNWHVDDKVRFFPEHFPPALPFEAAIKDLVLKEQPPRKIDVSKSDIVMTFGSCFAANLRKTLRAKGYSAQDVHIPEGMNNSFALLNYFKWALTGESLGNGAYDRETSGKIKKWSGDEDHQRHRDALTKSKLLVITFGLSEVWYDRLNGDVFWRGVPEKVFNEARHAFRVTTMAETKSNIVEMLAVLRAHLPDTPIFLTVSPIPLQATFTGQNCIVADAQSKSVIRAAVGEVIEECADENTLYWPAFEMIRWLGAHLSYATLHEKSARYPDWGQVANIVDAFCDTHFNTPELTNGTVDQLLGT